MNSASMVEEATSVCLTLFHETAPIYDYSFSFPIATYIHIFSKFIYHLLNAHMLVVLVFCKELINVYNIFSFEAMWDI